MSSSSGPEGSEHNVSIPRVSVPPDGEVTDPALLAPEAGAALVDPPERSGEDPSARIEYVCSSPGAPAPPPVSYILSPT